MGVRVERGEERSTIEKEHLLSASAEREREQKGCGGESRERRRKVNTREGAPSECYCTKREDEKLKKEPGDKKAATQVNSMNSSSP